MSLVLLTVSLMDFLIIHHFMIFGMKNSNAGHLYRVHLNSRGLQVQQVLTLDFQLMKFLNGWEFPIYCGSIQVQISLYQDLPFNCQDYCLLNNLYICSQNLLIDILLFNLYIFLSSARMNSKHRVSRTYLDQHFQMGH